MSWYVRSLQTIESWLKSLDGIFDKLRNMVHPLLSSSLAPLTARLDKRSSPGTKRLRWNSSIVCMIILFGLSNGN